MTVQQEQHVGVPVTVQRMSSSRQSVHVSDISGLQVMNALCTRLQELLTRAVRASSTLK